MHRILLWCCVVYVAFLTAGALAQLIAFVWRYFLLREQPNLRALYAGAAPTPIGPDTSPAPSPEPVWAVVTGASSGQGREFALQLADRGFAVFLLGSVRSEGTAVLVRAKGVPCRVLVKDFGRAFDPGFFDDVADALAPLDVAVLVNNVGHRTGWNPYHAAPEATLRDTIACGTLVQARLTHLLLPQLLARLDADPSTGYATGPRSAIVFVTAQCSLPNTGFAAAGYVDNPLTVPYLATYEASNAFGYYHAASLIAEYAHPRLDLLNVTPGAVLTENTEQALTGTPFAVDAHQFVATVLRFMGGNVPNGSTCAHWGHALSAAFVGIAPWRKGPTLRAVGERISGEYMAKYEGRRGRYVVGGGGE